MAKDQPQQPDESGHISHKADNVPVRQEESQDRRHLARWDSSNSINHWAQKTAWAAEHKRSAACLWDVQTREHRGTRYTGRVRRTVHTKLVKGLQIYGERWMKTPFAFIYKSREVGCEAVCCTLADQIAPAFVGLYLSLGQDGVGNLLRLQGGGRGDSSDSNPEAGSPPNAHQFLKMHKLPRKGTICLEIKDKLS